MSYLLIVDGVPTRKGASPREAWGEYAVHGHPVDCEGACVDNEGRISRVDELPLGDDAWRVTSHSGVTYFTGNKRGLFRHYGAFRSAHRLGWDGWATVYSS